MSPCMYYPPPQKGGGFFNKDKCMNTESTDKNAVNLELYKILISTRNFEIEMFWKRVNLFLVVLIALIPLTVASLTSKEASIQYQVVICGAGLLVSMAILFISTGGKYWQSRWEQRLHDYERENFKDIAFFSADKDRLQADVTNSLSFFGGSSIMGCISNCLILKKPSVSQTMIEFSIITTAIFFTMLVYLLTK